MRKYLVFLEPTPVRVMMGEGQSIVIGMNRHAIRPRDIPAFLAQRQVTARRLIKAEIHGADEIEFGLLSDGAFDTVKGQAGVIIRFASREAISSVVTAGDVIFFKATPIVASLPWIPGAIRQIAAIPSKGLDDSPATDMFFGAPLEAKLIQFVLLPDDSIEVLSPVQGEGVTCVRFVKEFGLLLAIALNDRRRAIRIASRPVRSDSEPQSSRNRAQIWDEIAESPERREILFLGRPRSMKSGRICVPVTLHGGFERELTLFMDGHLPGIPRWSDQRITMHHMVGAVDGNDSLRASFLPGERRAILRLERI